MTPYLEACFGGGGRIGFFCNRNLAIGITITITITSTSPSLQGSDTFLPYPADSARYPQRLGIRDLRTSMTSNTSEQVVVQFPIMSGAWMKLSHC